MRVAAGVLTGLALLIGGVARAAEFAEMVRELNVIQNRMVAGDMNARDEAARQFDMIEKSIAAVEPDGWADERNQRAAIIYLLCGGASAGLREIHEADFDKGGLGSMLAASIEYAEGREGGVPRALQDLDARHLPPMLGGHLALVQGSALVGENNARAIELFDLARLLMPGSLVEEAALRREIAVLDPIRDVGKITLLATRYVSKYPASPYGQNFWDILRRATIADPGFLPRAPKFEPIFERSAKGERAAYYLAVSRMAILAGDFNEARRTLEKARQAASHPTTFKRIEFYQGVLSALTQERSDVVLAPDEATGLDRQDEALLRIASGVKTGLDARKQPPAASDDDYEIAAVARQAITRSDELLKRASPQ
jgi:chemotaxis protein MotC